MSKTIYQYYKGSVSPHVVEGRFICGIEHEVENISCGELSMPAPLELHVTDDGSLQNGKELITVPSTIEGQLATWKWLHEKNNHVFYSERFSERTSTHVHVNMSDMTIDQTYSLLKMYSFIEPYFFAYVGPEREHNIHCVPLWATYMMRNINTFENDLCSVVTKWHKYTALNIRPLEKIKTIEFRHLFGTQDYQTFEKWLLFIKALHDWARADEGRFHLETYKELLQAGYPVLRDYVFTQTGDLGKIVHAFHRFCNQERCYDVYLNALTDVFPGLTNPVAYQKD